MSSAEQLQQLSAAIAALPPNVNPYLFVAEVFHSQMAPKPSKFFVTSQSDSLPTECTLSEAVMDVYFGLGSAAIFFGVLSVVFKCFTGSQVARS
jgi:hypothetical protein